MHKQILLIVVMLVATFNCFSQAAPPTVRRTSDQIRIEKESRNADSSFRDLQNLEVPNSFQKSAYEIMGQDIQPIYRKPNKKDLKDLIPAEETLKKYGLLSKQSNIGIFKLSADPTCAKNLNVLVATEKCASNSIPGGGTAFSFRTNAHRILHLADLVLVNDILKTDGVMQQGMMVNLGNIEIDQITSETKGIKFLVDFKPATNKAEIAKIDQTLTEGINADGFVYRLGFYAELNTTFALRSIAYRGTLMRSIKGVAYNEMDYDKRKDILVVFRIVEKDQNGDITILWKEIFRKDSPNLKDN